MASYGVDEDGETTRATSRWRDPAPVEKVAAAAPQIEALRAPGRAKAALADGEWVPLEVGEWSRGPSGPTVELTVAGAATAMTMAQVLSQFSAVRSANGRDTDTLEQLCPPVKRPKADRFTMESVKGAMLSSTTIDYILGVVNGLANAGQP
jgi:hypothetical protein